jgi:hypothetical protein
MVSVGWIGQWCRELVILHVLGFRVSIVDLGREGKYFERTG